ncbi:hypothetical protein NE237_005156 [Protea cynaroides]|uniref:Uncharacterized protein n=1 Tax=Protea cynaroides TaxID=273540 RepID=A0A9Q0QUB3_9MAGN|nr:hypothetical protein NE237_005156 [Protea cynaroides]
MLVIENCWGYGISANAVKCTGRRGFCKPKLGSRVSAGNGRVIGGAREVAGWAAKRLLEGRRQPTVVYISGEVESMAGVFGSEVEERQTGAALRSLDLACKQGLSKEEVRLEVCLEVSLIAARNTGHLAFAKGRWVLGD